MKSEWTIDLKARTATHRATGLVLSTKGPDADGGWDFRATTIPKSLPADAQMMARLAREGGEAYLDALRIDPDTLAEIGRALYGERWQSALAADLGVADRTMRRWAAGGPTPPGLRDELHTLLSDRGVAIRQLLDRL